MTGAYSGEFTLWNGINFSFESILQASVTYKDTQVLYGVLYLGSRLSCTQHDLESQWDVVGYH